VTVGRGGIAGAQCERSSLDTRARLVEHRCRFVTVSSHFRESGLSSTSFAYRLAKGSVVNASIGQLSGAVTLFEG
jgi:hypothetical protein